MKSIHVFYKESHKDQSKIYIYPFLVILLIVLLALSFRGNSSESKDIEVNFGGDLYPVLVVDGLTWMTKDLAINWRTSICFNNGKVCDARYYTWKAANEACINSGGRLPSLAEWRKTASSLLKLYNRPEQLSSTHHYYSLAQDKSTGFDIQFRGKGIPYKDGSGAFSERNKKGYYWTHDGYVVVFNARTKTMVTEHSETPMFYSCRCVRN